MQIDETCDERIIEKYDWVILNNQLGLVMKYDRNDDKVYIIFLQQFTKLPHKSSIIYGHIIFSHGTLIKANECTIN